MSTAGERIAGERRWCGVRAHWALLLCSSLTAWGCRGVGDSLAGWIELVRGHPLAPLAVIAIVVASGFVAAPLTLTMVPTMVLFGPGLGSLWTLVGATVSGALFFHLGAQGARTARRLGAPSLASGRVASLLERNGVAAVAAARFLPLAPYSVVNLALGASPVRFRDFLIGNLLGLIPWIALYAFAGARLRDLIVAPSGGAVAAVAASALALAAVSAAAAFTARRLLPGGGAQGPDQRSSS